MPKVLFLSHSNSVLDLDSIFAGNVASCGCQAKNLHVLCIGLCDHVIKYHLQFEIAMLM